MVARVQAEKEEARGAAEETAGGLRAEISRLEEQLAAARQEREAVGRDVESQAGRGTTFHIYLPKIMPRAKAHHHNALPLPSGSERVLLVDDETITEETAKRIGIKAFILKPIFMSDLAETMRKVLDSPRASLQDVVDQLRRRHGRDFKAAVLGIDMGSLAATGHHHGLDPFRQLVGAETGAFFHQPHLVVIEGEPTGLLDELQQVVAVEQGHGLARIENMRDAKSFEIAAVLQHGLPPVRGDDADTDAFRVGHAVQVTVLHCARVEGGDLVVVDVGGYEGLRRELARHVADVAPRNAQGLQVPLVGPEVVADGRHREGFAAQQPQVVGDVAGHAAELAAHFRHQEGHVQDVHLVGQDVLLELVGEHHDGVVGERSTNECRHGDFHA